MTDVATGYENLVFKFGRSPSLAASSLIKDLAGTYNYQSGEVACEVVSNSADDAVAGGGATKLTVVGQGADGLEISEEVTLTGAAPVALTNDYEIIYRAYCSDGEDDNPLTGANHGTITIRKTAGAVELATILPTNGQTLMCVYRIPSDKYGKLIGVDFFAFEGKGVAISVKTRRNRTTQNAWRSRLTVDGFQNAMPVNMDKVPTLLYPGEDIVVETISPPAGTFVSGHFSIELTDLDPAAG
jgi:hypothetical protein